MSRLPVFSVVAQAMAVFGLHIGKLLRWSLAPLLLSGAAVGLAVLAAVYGKGLLHDGGESRLWWIALVPAVFFVLWVWTPYAIRVNQLAVLGRVEPGGYMAQLVSGRSRSFLGYILLVTAIELGGLALSAAPFLAALKRAPEHAGFVLAGGAVSCLLALAFLVLTTPLNMIYAAVSLERHASLRAVFDLGSGVRWRIFCCMLLPALLFAVVGQMLNEVSNAFGGGKTVPGFLVFIPAQVLLTFFNSVTSTAVPAVVYRILSGLPDPRDASPEDTAPDAPDARPQGGEPDQP